ncbi:transmembrane protein yfca [Anaeramoeba flamelloides]|uniref:Transmembrane protein yfca n=1 Tax=Anaeramoeba flamelloides TaxID=1746091 RepID=A0ABQ8Z8C9_9EUKA|nr:transmembrane protein yfca [Anaeramoeba flamelloides]
MRSFKVFCLILGSSAFFSGMGLTMVALTHWKLIVPLSIVISGFGIYEAIFMSVALDLLCCCISLFLLWKNSQVKEGIKNDHKFLVLLVLPLIVGTICGLMLFQQYIEAVEKRLRKNGSYILMFFAIIFFAKGIRYRRNHKKKQKKKDQGKKEKIASDLMLQKDDLELKKIETNNTKSMKKTKMINNPDKSFQIDHNEIGDTAELSSSEEDNSIHKDKNEDLGQKEKSESTLNVQTKIPKEHGEDQLFGPFKLKRDYNSSKFKILLGFFGVAFFASGMFGGFLSFGPGLFLSILFIVFFDYRPLVGSFLGNSYMFIIEFICLIFFFIFLTIDYSFLIKYLLTLVPFSICGTLFGAYIGTKFDTEKIFYFVSLVFWVGFGLALGGESLH